MTTDRELLRHYVHEGSEPAFTELVRRHVDLVYGTALRQLCGNASLAQDVTQSVFTTLAAKPAALLDVQHLSAWLYTTTRFTVSHTVRTERRRQDREQKAQLMHAQLTASASSDLPEIPPQLFDTVLESLDDEDREAVLLRFFEGKSFAAIGATMDVSEDAARMRLTRALEKIRTLFARHGVTSSAAAIGAALTAQAVAAPVHLAATISTAALASTAGAAFAAPLAAKAAFLTSATLMTTTTKLVLGLASTAAVFSLGTAVHEHRDASALRSEIAALTDAQSRLQAAFAQSEQRAKTSDLRAAQAEQRAAELSRPPAPAAPSTAKPLSSSAPKTPSATEERRLTLERLAQMKPLLEAGQPIKGAIVMLLGGKPVQRPVEFVMGKETRFELGDDGLYAVTPTLNPDGSVKYQFVLSTTDPTRGEVKIVANVTQTPWGSFQLSTGGGQTIAFDPDTSGP